MGSSLLFTGAEWSYDALARAYETIEPIALGELGLEIYPNQIEIITAEQMLDAYASIGLPLMYNHWSFGKQFAYNELLYRKGARGLAYEIVINSNPCIAYLMEENTFTMQALVIAHACYGHNSFFKGNYLFRTWTDASAIVNYLLFAKNYIAECEERYGLDATESLLDSCHALMNYGVDRYKRPAPIRLAPRSYFCTCWNVTPSDSPRLSWLIFSILRRRRTRAPSTMRRFSSSSPRKSPPKEGTMRSSLAASSRPCSGCMSRTE